MHRYAVELIETSLRSALPDGVSMAHWLESVEPAELLRKGDEWRCTAVHPEAPRRLQKRFTVSRIRVEGGSVVLEIHAERSSMGPHHVMFRLTPEEDA